jgi:hypothetical protein
VLDLQVLAKSKFRLPSRDENNGVSKGFQVPRFVAAGGIHPAKRFSFENEQFQAREWFIPKQQDPLVPRIVRTGT